MSLARPGLSPRSLISSWLPLLAVGVFVAGCDGGTSTPDLPHASDAASSSGADLSGGGGADAAGSSQDGGAADAAPFNNAAFSSGGSGCGAQDGIGCPSGTYSYNCILNMSATPPEPSCTKMTSSGYTVYCCPDPLCTRFPAGDSQACGPANNRPSSAWTCPQAAHPGGDCTPDGTGVYCCSRS